VIHLAAEYVVGQPTWPPSAVRFMMSTVAAIVSPFALQNARYFADLCCN
jgi:hypothetical protein